MSQPPITLPTIIQAPMAGISTPQLAAAVSNSEGMGSLGLGSVNARTAATLIKDTQERTQKPFCVNFFAHKKPAKNAKTEQLWLENLSLFFEEFHSSMPQSLSAPYQNFDNTPEIMPILLELRPAVVSFHFGLPSQSKITALKNAGITLAGTVTNLKEAKLSSQKGLDILIAQGVEAGGHRGFFDPEAHDDAYSTAILTRLLIKNFSLPVIAAGGIMDGAAIVSALKTGAVAAQLGTAFLGCPEAATSEAHRQALMSPAAYHTQLTHLISGRQARMIPNRFTFINNTVAVPDYPIAYDAGKALHKAATHYNNHEFAAHWAGQGAPLCRFLPADKLMNSLKNEMNS